MAVALDIGDTPTLDTTEATTDDTDAACFADCDPKYADATGWYTFSSPTRTGVDIDTFESSYSVAIVLFDDQLQLTVRTSEPVRGADLTVDETPCSTPTAPSVTGTYWCTEAPTSQVFGGIEQTVRGV